MAHKMRSAARDRYRARRPPHPSVESGLSCEAIVPVGPADEDHGVVAALQRTGEPALAVVDDVDGVVLGLEPALHEARDLLLVLDDQDAHAPGATVRTGQNRE